MAEKKGYSRKVEQRLNPFHYDKNSTSFQNGAWKNHSPEEAERNRRVLAK